MNRISTLFILCFLFTSQIFPQKVIQFEEPLKTGQIYLTDSIAIPYVNPDIQYFYLRKAQGVGRFF